MPAFFIPAAESPEQEVRVLDAIVSFNELDNPERFYSIDYEHNGQRHQATVGQTHYVNGEVVVAILKQNYSGAPYLICTLNRGVARGEPIYASGTDDTRATQFTSH